MADVTYKKADSEKALSTHKQLATKTANEAAKLVISDEKSYEKAMETIAKVKKYKKELDAQRKRITNPLDQAKKEVMALFSPTKAKLEETEKMLSEALLAYREKVLAEEAEREAKLQAQIDSGDMDFDDALNEAMEAPQTQKTELTKHGNVTFRKIKDIRITDLTKVPKDYFVLDMTRLRADALGNKAAGVEPVDIPGVEVYERESV